MVGLNTADLEQFKREGLGANVKPLDPDNVDGRRLASGFGNLLLVNKAPHPNAAKVFVNWLLSKEGQKAWVEATGQNSRRLEVAGPELTAPKTNVKYEVVERETSSMIKNVSRAMEISKEIIK